MTRARATALALVNWKGVFYERYVLDRRVTALEGANGAGKTTVMIAAYIVLLPDMTRLRFTNLGETAAIGGDRGIWGRLGEPTRPSYAALELDLGDGTRVVAGVLLTRKAEPTLELTPFLISDLPASARLQDLLLLRSDTEESVPELAELRLSVEAARGRIEVFASAKDYFSALFELGVGALRLASDEDRGRLGDMLRTSMTGGISRAITSELRSFLLREQGNITSTLGRMRENLNACRRTRIEVSEAQLLEQEISGIYDAGQGMFAAALQATRETARERREETAQLGQSVARAKQAQSDAERLATSTAERETELSQKLIEARTALEVLRERARVASSREALRAIKREVDQEREQREVEAAAARGKQQATSAAREAGKRRREAAQQDQERAARGLSDFQSGLDELYRRASAYRNAQRLLDQVAALNGEAVTDAHALSERSQRVGAELARIDAERLQRERALTLAAEHEREWQRALELLSELGHQTQPQDAYETARGALRELAEARQKLADKPALLARLREHQRLAERQRSLQEAARAAGLAPDAGDSPQRVETRLAETEAELGRLDEQRLTLEDQRRRLDAQRGLLRERISKAEASLGKYRRLLQRVQRVAALAEPFAPTQKAAQRLRDSLIAEQEQLGAKLAAETLAREQLLHEANQLEAAGGHFSPALLKLRDDLDGELLGNRFEELDLKQAARLEALLGPLTHAIVVDNVDEASQRLRDKPRELSELRLVAAGTDLSTLHPIVGEDAQDLFVSEGPVVRVTRRPERPTLGRKAREARVTALRREAADRGEALAQLQGRVRGVVQALGELDHVLAEAELLERGDPTQIQQELLVEDAELAQAEEHALSSLSALTAPSEAARLRAQRLRSLLSEAFLLDAEDHGEAARRLTRELSELDGAEQAASRLARAEQELGRLLDALRLPAPTRDELLRFEQEREALANERDRNFRLQEALTELRAELPALAFRDAERSLGSTAEVAPALEEQHRSAREAVLTAEQQVLAAEAAWEEATSELQRAEAQLAAVTAHAQRLDSELGAQVADDIAAEDAALAMAQLSQRIERLTADERELVATRGAQAERLRKLSEDLLGLERAEKQAADAAEPAAQRWRALCESAAAARVLQTGEVDDDGPRSALELRAEARSRAQLLHDRLSTARGGEALARELSAPATDEDFLTAWLKVREWLARRVPAQVAQVDDPLLALERLRDHLSVLTQRLDHQEADLRGASEDVAGGIEVQLRRAKAQVRRLNQNLSGVAFGSIAGIRVELGRSPQMEPVLRALAEGRAQELLFQSNLPTEEALSELLRRYGGGRSGGARVLDYREYLELSVEVQRKADGSWEPANPTRLSTGEAIGVGAALMMVILTEWERDANLLRARRGPGSLRFLFLDEANRLSQDNLGSLFDLCENLDLQLLIAAPEVARASGNTTYRLVRKVTDDGREEVIVSGRRAIGAELLDGAHATAAPAVVQGSLFE